MFSASAAISGGDMYNIAFDFNGYQVMRIELKESRRIIGYYHAAVGRRIITLGSVPRFEYKADNVNGVADIDLAVAVDIGDIGRFGRRAAAEDVIQEINGISDIYGAVGIDIAAWIAAQGADISTEIYEKQKQ
jgi:hypothetical protein